MSEHGIIDPIGDLGLPIEISTYTRTTGPDGASRHWLQDSCDAENLEAAIVAARTLLTDSAIPIARIEFNLMRGNRLVEGLVQDSATG